MRIDPGSGKNLFQERRKVGKLLCGGPECGDICARIPGAGSHARIPGQFQVYPQRLTVYTATRPSAAATKVTRQISLRSEYLPTPSAGAAAGVFFPNHMYFLDMSLQGGGGRTLLPTCLAGQKVGLFTVRLLVALEVVFADVATAFLACSLLSFPRGPLRHTGFQMVERIENTHEC
jgi:hypothetical protein